MGLAPTGKRRLFTAHADSGRSLRQRARGQIDPVATFSSKGHPPQVLTPCHVRRLEDLPVLIFLGGSDAGCLLHCRTQHLWREAPDRDLGQDIGSVVPTYVIAYPRMSSISPQGSLTAGE